MLEEGDYDATVSRAYYSMFYSAEAILLTRDVKFSSHRTVISSFGKGFIKTGVFEKEFGKSLSRAFEKRLISDYSYEAEIDRDTAKDLLSSSQEFLAKIENYLKGSNYLK